MLALGIVFIVTLLLGVPVLAVIGLSTVVPILLYHTIPLSTVAQSLYTGTDQFPLIAVAFFLLAGSLMQRSGMTEDIFNFSNALVGSIAGGIGAVAIMASMIFAALSGSGLATTAAVGTLTIDGMLKKGYRKEHAGAVVASGGVLGIMIPPSNPLIIYGVIAGQSVGTLFIAGILPGIMIGLSMILLVWFQGKRYHLVSDEPFSIMKLGMAFWKSKWALIAPVFILGSIYFGIATPTESAEIAVVYSLFVGLVIKRTLKFQDIIDSIIDTVKMCGIMLAMVGFATGFGRLLTIFRFPQNASMWILSITENPYLVLVLIMGFLIFIGTWMETLSQVIILTPVFLPVVTALHISPIVFGILFVLACEIGFLTPPVGGNLYVAAELTKAPLERIAIAEIPYIVLLILWSLIIIFFPKIILWLPMHMMG
jgi:C4-dicarboxylate transporter DctM subunit